METLVAKTNLYCRILAASQLVEHLKPCSPLHC